MINWRSGKAGFVGAAKRFIKGVFQYSYTVTSADVAPPEPDPVPSGNKRTTSFSGGDRTTMAMGTNRTSSTSSRNRKSNL